MAMRDGKPLEAVITEGMRHPHIVNTLAHAIVAQDGARLSHSTHDSVASTSLDSSLYRKHAGTGSEWTSQNSGSKFADQSTVAWLLLEFCDKGCLQVLRTSSHHIWTTNAQSREPLAR
jgi:hypothetical protein